MFAHNAFGDDFGARVAFLECSEADRTVSPVTATEFIGRGGSSARPAALARAATRDASVPRSDPCFALQTNVIETRRWCRARDRRSCSARVAISTTRATSSIAIAAPSSQRRKASRACGTYWNRTLGAVHVADARRFGRTFSRTAGCSTKCSPSRMWGRSGFYQSGGAFGFRDQLQDACALLHAEPGSCASSYSDRRPIISVPAGRCPTLVASAEWTRRPHADLG